MFASVVIALIGANDFGIGFSTVGKSLYLNVSRIGQRFSLRNSNETRTLTVFRENCFLFFCFPHSLFVLLYPIRWLLPLNFLPLMLHWANWNVSKVTVLNRCRRQWCEQSLEAMQGRNMLTPALWWGGIKAWRIMYLSDAWCRVAERDTFFKFVFGLLHVE